MELAANVKARVVVATVTVERRDGARGCGVLVPGGLVLTATHCIDWSGTGGMVLGDWFLETVVTRSGARFRLSPWFADPLTDIAALGEADNQVFSDDAEAFERWRESVEPVPLSGIRLESSKVKGSLGSLRVIPPVPRRVHVLTHRGEWVVGKVVRYGPPGPHPGQVALETEVPVESGTSGSPVVDGSGRLVGVVSTARA